MRSIFIYILAAILSAPSIFAQRDHRGGGGSGAGAGAGGDRGANGGNFNHGGGNAPNTFMTRTSAAPAATKPGTGTGTAISNTASATRGSSSAGASLGASSGSVDASLIPPFGIAAGVKANDGTANCVGDGGKGIPCDCPPSLNTFVSAVEDSVAAGAAFPSGNSAADQLARLGTCIVTLQNFKGGAGSGVGCPAVSTTWKELQAQLQAEAK